VEQQTIDRGRLKSRGRNSFTFEMYSGRDFCGLTANEWRRRATHMLPGLLPLLLWPIPHPDPLSWRMSLIITCLVLTLSGTVFTHYRRIERTHEIGQRIPAIVGYASSILLAFWLFPSDPEIGMAALAILAFGDGSAALGGMLIGGPTLPWNRDKTVAGMLCFIAVGLPMATLCYWGEATNTMAQPHGIPITIPRAGLVITPIVLIGAFVESIRSPINDNIRVGLIVVSCLACMQFLFVS
jgi:phytol kinase